MFTLISWGYHISKNLLALSWNFKSAIQGLCKKRYEVWLLEIGANPWQVTWSIIYSFHQSFSCFRTLLLWSKFIKLLSHVKFYSQFSPLLLECYITLCLFMVGRKGKQSLKFICYVKWTLHQRLNLKNRSNRWYRYLFEILSLIF